MYLPQCPVKAQEADCRLLADGRERTASAADFPCAAGPDFYRGNACSPHWHEEFELVIVQQGTLEATVNGSGHVLEAGEGIFVNTGVLHAYRETAGTGAAVTYLLFLPSLIGGRSGSVFWKKYLDPLISSLLLSGLPLRSAPWERHILAGAQEAADLLRREPPGYEIEVRTHLSRAVHLICANARLSGPVSSREKEAAQAMRQMLSFLDENYAHPLSTEEIAASAHVSVRSCQRLFRRFTSKSPKQFLTSLRIEKAQVLLQETTLDIPTIGSECGFADQSYFTKQFHRLCGCPPARYRLQQRSGEV